MVKQYVKRFFRLLLGLAVSALGIVMMLQANVGLDPWNVLHQGLNLVTGISFGMVTIIVGASVILLSILLGERIGIGTVANIVICGFLIDGILYLNIFPQQQNFWPGLLMLLGGLELLTLGTFWYMSSALGSGPRDALMVAVARKIHKPVGLCRSVLELVVIIVGWIMGGKVGVGTVIAALGIGLFFQVNFSLLHFDPAKLHQETFLETWQIWTHKPEDAAAQTQDQEGKV